MQLLELLRTTDLDDLRQQKESLAAELEAAIRERQEAVTAFEAVIHAVQLMQTVRPPARLQSFGSSEPPPRTQPSEELPPVRISPKIVAPPPESPLPLDSPADATGEIVPREPLETVVSPKLSRKTVAATGTKEMPAPHPEIVEPASGTFTVADRAKLYVEASGRSSAMAIAAGIGLPAPATLVRVLENDPRFEKGPGSFWDLAKS